MNKFFRVIWSRTQNCMVVVPEVGGSTGKQSSGRGQRSRRAAQKIRAAFLATSVSLMWSATLPIHAQTAELTLPQNGQIGAGQAQISQNASGSMVINQTSGRAVLNWDSFDVGRDASVTFNQPSTSSAALNRVTGSAPSQIFGRIQANGQVFVSNSAGVYFAPGARVDAGGLVATTHALRDDEFMSGNINLRRDGATGAIINEGELTATDGGYIALLAPEVRNRGVVTARLGTVALAAGEAYELQIDDNGSLINLRVDPAQIETLVENGHLIHAPGGRVIMSAGAANDVRSGVVRNTGTIEARGIQKVGGRVFLGGGRIETTRSSRIIASPAITTSPRPNLRPSSAEVHIDGSDVQLGGQVLAAGGTVAIEGSHISIADGALVDVSSANMGGSVLIGGDWQGGADNPNRVFQFSDDMRQALSVTMDAGAEIDASATDIGDGGTIVLWSSLSLGGETLAYGTLRADGGTQGGNGGQIETSGYRLDVTGIEVSTAASSGQVGDWLLDPGNVTIATSGSDPIPGSGGPSGDVTIAPSTIEAGLVSANVTVTTGIGGDFTLSVNDAITYAGADERTLTFGSTGRMFINDAITSTSGALNVILASEIDETTGFEAAGLGVAVRAAIDTNGGDFWLGGGQLSGSWNGHTVGLGAARGGAGNQIGAELNNATITTSGGDVRIVGTSSISSGIAAFSNDSSIDAGSGDIELITNSLNFDHNTGGDLLTVNTTGSFTLAPFSTSWGSDLDWNSVTSGGFYTNSGGSLTGLSVSDSLSGFTLGGSGLTDNITINSDLSVAGGIAIEGGDIVVGAALTSSATGDLTVTGSAVDINANLAASGSISITATATDVQLGAALSNTATGASTLDIAAARNIRLETGGDISASTAMDTTLRSDTDSDSDGIVFVESASINTSGGNLSFGQSGQTAVIGGETVLVGGDTFFQRGTAQTLSTGGGDVNIYGEVLIANTSGLTITTDGGDTALHGLVNSGNAYSFEDRTANNGSGSWTEARTQAINGTGGGAAIGDSYLVNITSRLENSISGLVTDYAGAWIGAYRADPAGSLNWSHPDGPEAGEHFFTQSGSGSNGGGSAETGYYSNFGEGEPNGGLDANGESVGQFFGTAGQWNDLSVGTTYSDNSNPSQYAVKGFVRETNIAGSPLTIDAGTGSVTVDGGLGTRRTLASIDVTAAEITVDGEGISTTGTQSYSGDLTITGGPAAAELTGDTITVGGTLTGSVVGTLEQNATLATSTDVALTGTTNWDLRGSQTLSSLNMVAGTSITNSNDGASLTVNGNATLAGSVTTDDAQTYSGAVTLAGDTVLRTIASNISFGGTVNSDDPGTPYDLTAWIDPETAYFWADWVSATATSVSGTITVGGDVINVTYSNPNGFFGTELSGGTNYWTGRNGGAFVGPSPYISQNIDNGPTDDIIQLRYQGSQTLTFDQSVENLAFAIVSMNGNGYGFDQVFAIESYTGFDAGFGTASEGYFGTGALETEVVDGVYQLNDAETNSPSEPHGAIRFTGSFSELTWESLSNEAWNGFTVGVSGTTSTAGEVVFNGTTGAVAGLGDVTVNANMTTTASIDIAASITVNGIADLGGNITTTGNQDYNEQVTLASDVTLSTTNGGDVMFANTVDGAQALSVTASGTGDVTFDGIVGGITALNNLTVVADEVSAGVIKLATNGTLDITNATDSSLAEIISGSGVSLEKAGAGDLTLTGANTFDGGATVTAGVLVQGITASGAVGSLTSGAFGTGDVTVEDGGALDANGFALAYGVDIAGTGVSNSGAIFNGTATDVALNGPITLEDDAAIRSEAGGALTFYSTVNGASELTVGTNAALTFNAALGGSTALAALSINSGAFDTSFAATANATGDISIAAADIAIGGTLSSTSGDIDVTSSGAVTQTAALSSNGLNLSGAGDFTLTHVGNSVETLAGGSSVARVGVLDFVNAGALSIGTVTDTGLTSSGTVSVATLSGDLTLGAGIDTSAAAITLNAGQSAVAGTQTGGDIIVSGSPTLSVGSAGTIRLFSGSVTDSTGLTALVGNGTGRFRYNSDETTTNYTTGLATDVAHAIYRESIALSGSIGDEVITYGDVLPNFTLSGSSPANGDGAVGITPQSPQYSGAGVLEVGSYTLAATGLSGLGYSVGGITSGTMDVETKTLSFGALSAQDKTYDSTRSSSLTGLAAISGGGSTSGDGKFLTGDTVTLSGTESALFADANAGSDIDVIVSGLSISGTDVSNYELSTAALSADITARVVGLTATREYDATTDLSGDIVLTTGVAGETLSYSGATAASSHVSGPDGMVSTADNFISAITLQDATGSADNYALPTLNSANTAVSITPRALTVTLDNTEVTKTYDATDLAPTGFAPDYGISGLVGGDTGVTWNTSGTTYNSADVAMANSLTVSGLSLNSVIGTNGSETDDYAASATSVSVAASITPAPLVVTANDSAKFVTRPDPAGFAGVLYDGFVGSEGTADLGGSLVITRSNAGTDTAGIYSDVLVPSGQSSTNYAITYEAGDFTVVPANQLLVIINNLDHTYGSGTGYSFSSVSYFDGSMEIRLDDGSVSGSSTTIGANNLASITDSAGGSATFALAPQGAGTSNAGHVTVGGYQIDVSGAVTENSGNFSNTVTVTGSHNVTPLAVTASATGVSRVYDGTTYVTNATIGLNTLEIGDNVGVSGVGEYDDDRAGIAKAYTISDLKLAGTDAGNYVLGNGPSISGSDGVITPRSLNATFTGIDRVYDGTTGTTVTTNDDRLTGDDLTILRNAEFDTKNVGTDKTVLVSGISLSGTDALNYSIAATDTATADIMRLSSVTWVGGATGNWFDPANWAGGAVPDLSNVENVIIPTGVRVTFDDNVVAPAEVGPVNIEQLGSAGILEQTGGTLNVGFGGITLDEIAQSGGTLTSKGDITLKRLRQTAGTMSISDDADLVVTEDYEQTGSGTISVSGDARLTDGVGGLVIGNLAVGGNLDGVSTDGPITQTGATAITVGGTTTLRATQDGSPADIILDGPQNDFKGPIDAKGATITLADLNEIELRDVEATETLNVTSGGTMTLAGTISTNRLNLDSTGGDVIQTGGVLKVANGPGAISATGSIRLTELGNQIPADLILTAPIVQATSGTQVDGINDNVITAIQGSLPNAFSIPSAQSIPPNISIEIVVAPSNQSGTSSDDSATDAGDSAGASGITIDLLEQPNGTRSGLVSVSIPAGTTINGSGFSFDLSSEVTELFANGPEPTAILASGSSLPNWLRFDSESFSFSASAVPDQGLPVEVLILSGSTEVIVVITESAE